ncbi:phosphatidylethanolamine-binding protein, partial [Vararia minispora EC-137]
VTADANITFTPSLILQVQFPQPDGTVFNVTAGANVPRNGLPPSLAGEDPPVIVPSAQSFDFGNFVIAMVDLDAPTPQNPNSSEIRHFLGSNFTLFPAQNPDALALMVNFTPAISDYLQPTPPAESDAHRYVFLIYTQSPDFDEQTFVTPNTPVSDFSISDFATATGLGNPLGGTFIFVAPDNSTSA